MGINGYLNTHSISNVVNSMLSKFSPYRMLEDCVCRSAFTVCLNSLSHIKTARRTHTYKPYIRSQCMSVFVCSVYLNVVSLCIGPCVRGKSCLHAFLNNKT